MQFTVNRKLFLDAIGKARLAAETKSTIPILTCLRFHAGTQVVTVTGTDLEICIQQVCPVLSCDEPLDFVAPWRIMSDFLKASKADTALVEVTGKARIETFPVDCERCNKTGKINEQVCWSCKGKITGSRNVSGSIRITCGGSLAIETLPVADWPELPDFGSAEWPLTGMLEIPGSEWLDMTSKVTYAISAEETRLTPNGFLLEISDRIRMVATDGHRLAVVKRGREVEGRKAIRALIPKPVASKLSSIMGKGTGNLSVYLATGKEKEAKYLVAAYESTILASRLISGNFPDYERVIPNYPVTPAKAAVSDFIAGLDAVKVCADERSRAIKLTFNCNEVAILAESADRGRSVFAVPCECNDATRVTVGLNLDYLRQFLASLPKDDSAYIFCNADSGPARRPAEGTEDTMIDVGPEEMETARVTSAAKGAWLFQSVQDAGYSCVVMPLRV